MGPLAAKLLLESGLIPFILAGLAMMVARRSRAPSSIELIPALAIFLAVGTTFILAFGWPTTLVLSARIKVMLSAVIGLALGVAVARQIRWSEIALAAGAVGIPLWIGMAALQQGQPAFAGLIFPIAAVLAAACSNGRAGPIKASSGLMIVLTAFGLAAIGYFGKSLSYMQLTLALGSAFLAIWIVGQRPPPNTAIIMAAALLLALFAALMLYSQASFPALLLLSTLVAAEPAARFFATDSSRPPPFRRIFLFSMAPLLTAIVMARIDAGSLSLY